MILKNLFKTIFKKDNISNQEQAKAFKEDFTTSDTDSESIAIENNDLDLLKEHARKEIEKSIENTISTYTQKGFIHVDDRVIEGIRIADEFVVMEKDNLKFIILDGIFSCSKNTESIEAVCPECLHFDGCKYCKK